MNNSIETEQEEDAFIYDEYLRELRKIKKGAARFSLLPDSPLSKYPELAEYVRWLYEYKRCKAFEDGVKKKLNLFKIRRRIVSSKIRATRVLSKLKRRYEFYRSKNKLFHR